MLALSKSTIHVLALGPMRTFFGAWLSSPWSKPIASSFTHELRSLHNTSLTAALGLRFPLAHLKSGRPVNSSITRKFFVAAMRRGPTLTELANRRSLASSCMLGRSASKRRIFNATGFPSNKAWVTSPTQPFPRILIPSIIDGPTNRIPVIPIAVSSLTLNPTSRPSEAG